MNLTRKRRPDQHSLTLSSDTDSHSLHARGLRPRHTLTRHSPPNGRGTPSAKLLIEVDRDAWPLPDPNAAVTSRTVVDGVRALVLGQLRQAPLLAPGMAADRPIK